MEYIPERHLIQIADIVETAIKKEFDVGSIEPSVIFKIRSYIRSLNDIEKIVYKSDNEEQPYVKLPSDSKDNSDINYTHKKIKDKTLEYMYNLIDLENKRILGLLNKIDQYNN